MKLTMRPSHLAAGLLLCALTLAGCAASEPQKADGLTWQQAKQAAQQTENEIVALIPKGLVISSSQRPEGTLLSCADDQHQWSGRTTVTLVPGTEIETIVSKISAHYKTDGSLIPEEYTDISGDLTVQLIAPDRRENYLVGSGTKDSDELEVTSFSACFTLPEGMYPGGKF